ncbi:hypothetical protein [Denitrobaculum tricleocarpae]|uniref:Uncharacterized protein n=1 Tax=Denitrobaculum tricleocarpae TaxID=2591009 RepID=A0A545TM90_9PROT|nr:hypothetical protein [Denitrobaculum tricleocarpae]TQV78342.1 hypothetical protein FKG95_17390 [Denitrobaculum tricleocarpae]
MGVIAEKIHDIGRLRIKIRSYRPIAFSVLPAILLCLFVKFQPWVSPWVMMADPIVYLKGEVYTGAISNLGAIMWMCAASIALFAGVVLVRMQNSTEYGKFLLHLGILTVALSFDDFFLIHDVIAPYLGIDEKIIYALYALFSVFIFLRFPREILTTDNFLLLLGFFLFGASIFLDVLPFSGPTVGFLEDACKFVGIVAWSTYLVRASWMTLSQNKPILKYGKES